MPSTRDEIPTLPVVFALGLAAFAVMLWILHRRGPMTLPRVLAGDALCIYGAGVVANTLLPIYVGVTGPRPHWTVFLNLVPLTNTEPRDMLQNVVVFLPLGVLLPIIARVGSVRQVLLYAFLLSLTMELLQLLNAVTGHGGHIADVDDLMANTLGAPLGYAIFRGALYLPPAARLATAATWAAPTDDAGVARPVSRSEARRPGHAPGGRR